MMSVVARAKDHSVRLITEKELAEIAVYLRKGAGISNNAPTFNIVRLLKEYLIPNISKFDRHKIELEIVPEVREPNDPAVVKYTRLNKFTNDVKVTLHVDEEILELAKLGEPESKFIFAHEIGHIILHNFDAKAFSSDFGDQNHFEQQEYSAEWQANMFAGHLLLPDSLVIEIRDESILTRMCEIPRQTVRDRIKSLSNNKSTSRHFSTNITPHYTGSLCECGGYSVVQSGLIEECLICKKMF